MDGFCYDYFCITHPTGEEERQYYNNSSSMFASRCLRMWSAQRESGKEGDRERARESERESELVSE